MSWKFFVVAGFCAMYGVIAFATGGHAVFRAPQPGFDPMLDNTLRFLAGVWFGVGIGFFAVAWDPSSTTLFRVLMAALFIGGIGRLVGVMHSSGTPLVWALIALELLPPVFLLPLQAQLASPTEVVAEGAQS